MSPAHNSLRWLRSPRISSAGAARNADGATTRRTAIRGRASLQTRGWIAFPTTGHAPIVGCGERVTSKRSRKRLPLPSRTKEPDGNPARRLSTNGQSLGRARTAVSRMEGGVFVLPLETARHGTARACDSAAVRCAVTQASRCASRYKAPARNLADRVVDAKGRARVRSNGLAGVTRPFPGT